MNITIRDLGAIGDGKTDDSPAIQKALDMVARNGGVVRIPTGNYLCKTGLRLPDDGTQPPQVEGEGPGSIINYTGTDWAFFFGRACFPTNNSYGRPSLSKLSIRGTAAAAGGLKLYGTTRFVIDKIDVSGFRSGVGIGLIENCWIGAIRDSRVTYCHYGIEATTSATGNRSFNAIMIEGGEYQCNDVGIVIGNPDNAPTVSYPGHGSVLHGVCVEGNNQGGVLVAHGRAISIRDCYFETNGEYHVRIGCTQAYSPKPFSCRIIDNYLSGTAKTVIDLQKANAAIVRGNNIFGGEVGVRLTGAYCIGCIVEENTFAATTTPRVLDGEVGNNIWRD